jgi:dipeptidase D
MNDELLGLKPEKIWKNFKSLCDIPRPSKKEEQAIAFVKKFGEDLGLETVVDETGNVIIRKPATKGMENRKGVILQGHLDMVPQKNSDTSHDFEKDPIQAYVDGEWVTAKGTTLGADNGIGVAAALSVLESTDLEHGPIEALFTIDEETGMTGAFGLKPGVLQGDILINMDSEDEGELYVGCAGGMDANVKIPYTEIAVPADSVAYEVSVTGLKGGHSGMDIILGRGNSNKLLIRFLRYAAINFGLKVSSVEGGSLRNAIPRESFSTVVVPAELEDQFLSALKEHNNMFTHELSGTEPDLKLQAKKADMPESVMDADAQKNLLNGVYGCPNGVMRMSDSIPGLVETSTNLAVVKTENGVAQVLSLMRSSVDTAKDDLANMIESVFELAGAEVTFEGAYPGWKPNPDSIILKEMKSVYQQKFGKVPEIKAIHAGLECGLLGGAYPNVDMISFGPTIRFPHSPDEKVNIETVQKFWDFLVETLRNIPKK